MDAFLTSQRLELLHAFVTALRSSPKLIHTPKLAFFKEYLISVGATLPEEDTEMHEEKPKEQKAESSVPEPEPESEPIEEEEQEEEEEEEEEQIEPADDQLMPCESFEPPKEENENKTVSEEEMDQANLLKIEAISLQNEGKLDDAIAKFSEAIKLNPLSGILYASRANCFLRVKRPLAAIHDCTQAIKISPDSAKPYKVRGKAYRFIGDYEKSKSDLDMGNRLDFDEETYSLQKFVNERVNIREEIRKKKQIREDRKRPKTEKHPESTTKQQPPPQQEENEDFSMPDFGGGGMGGMPPDFLQKMMSNPEVLSLLGDPEIAAALSNPAKLQELLANPKYAKLAEVFSKFAK